MPKCLTLSLSYPGLGRQTLFNFFLLQSGLATLRPTNFQQPPARPIPKQFEHTNPPFLAKTEDLSLYKLGHLVSPFFVYLLFDLLLLRGLDRGQPASSKVDCFVKTRKFDLIDIIAEALKFVVSLSN